MCGGGLFRDSIILVTGPTGTGKTLTGLRFAEAAYNEGERCLLATFDETREQLSRNAAGWGMDLAAMEASGLLRVLSDYPEVASLEDHFIRLRRIIEDYHPRRLVIDTLSALERIVSPRALLDFVISLGALLRQHEITTLLTSAPTGRVTPLATPAIAMEIASLTDVSILLRYVERAGEIKRCIAVLQSRASAHDPAIREAVIDETGMAIGEPMTELFPIMGDSLGGPQWPVETRAGACGRAGRQGADQMAARVRRRQKQEPPPGFGSYQARPLLASAKAATIHSPSPAPPTSGWWCGGRLNRWKSCGTKASGTPGPRSHTRRSIQPFCPVARTSTSGRP